MSAIDRPATGPISSPDRSSPTRPCGPVLPGAAAILGLGAVTAWGWNVEATWNGLLDGRAAVDPPHAFDTTGHRTRLVSEVPDAPGSAPGPSAELLASPWWRRASRADRFAVAAALEAWHDSGLARERLDDEVVGVFFGGSTAAMDDGETFFRRLVDLDSGHPRISLLASHPLDGPGNEVARQLGVHGPVESLSSACASGGLALGAALEALRAGEVDVAIAGGSDALCQLTYAGFNSLRAVDEEPCAPFHRDRAGLSLGEGAGVLVLESAERAARRPRGREPNGNGRRAPGQPIAYLLGAGASCDAHHMTAPHPQGEGASRAIEAALADAGIDAAEIGFVNAHGTGTPHNDRAEWQAIHRVFGERALRLPVTSTKGLLGHFLGSSGSIEAVVTALCLRHARVHATPGRGPIDPEMEVDLVVDRPRAVEARAAVSTSFAFGGSNAAVILGRAEGGSIS